MAREDVTIRVREAVIYDGTGEVTCDVRDTPHTWDVLLRCNQEELDAFPCRPSSISRWTSVGGGPGAPSLPRARRRDTSASRGSGSAPTPITRSTRGGPGRSGSF